MKQSASERVQQLVDGSAIRPATSTQRRRLSGKHPMPYIAGTKNILHFPNIFVRKKSRKKAKALNTV